jgi:preprotein translocase subunit SecY
VAGVGWRLFTGLFQFIGQDGGNCLLNFSGTEFVPCAGKILSMLQSVINGDATGALISLVVIIVTAIIFLLVVYVQSLKVEVPLSFDRLRGYGIRWPLAFFYTGVIPVILVSALSANIQLFAGLLEKSLGHATLLGGFSSGQPISGFAFWIGSNQILYAALTGSMKSVFLLQAVTHLIFYMALSVVFAIFWVKTSGTDAASQAKNILDSGLQIPGFRKDERILESVLERYIMPLTIMGGAAIGLLAALADLLGALTSGTAILLAVMIIYQYYNQISQQHSVDMPPIIKRLEK